MLKEFFIDVDGHLSFKRLQTAIFVFLFVMVIVANLFWGFVLTGALTELLVFLITYGYTGIAIEKFTKRGLTSVEANDQAMLLEAQVNVEQKKVDNAIATGEKLQEKANEAADEAEKKEIENIKP